MGQKGKYLGSQQIINKVNMFVSPTLMMAKHNESAALISIMNLDGADVSVSTGHPMLIMVNKVSLLQGVRTLLHKL